MAQVRWEGFDGDPVRLQAQLEHLLAQTEGRAVILIDHAGRLLSLAGDAPQFDVTTFVSLMAADFCATRELARLLGEDRFHSVAHQGDDLSLYLTQVTPDAILALVYDRDTTLGLVRYGVRRALPAIAATIREGTERSAAEAPALGETFGEEALDRVDRLFGSPA
jgi:predicted regulator of Ras-like GTPase activity (Roadblock/LC7/MglB family)